MNAQTDVDADVSVIVSEYLVLPAGASLDDPEALRFALKVAYRGPNSYAVTNSGRCLRHDGRAWSYESGPSSRTERFKAAYRMDPESALALARKHVGRQKVNGKTWAEWQSYFAGGTP